APVGSDSAHLGLDGPDDLSGCDFVAFYARFSKAARVALTFQDQRHHSVRVVAPGGTGEPEALQFWPVDQVRWLPDENLPRYGAVVSAPPDLVAEGEVFVVPVV